MSNEVLYNNQVISFLEELWGDGFLSPGGSDEVKKVLEGIKIKDQRVLDIGSGSGACAVLLTKNYLENSSSELFYHLKITFSQMIKRY